MYSKVKGGKTMMIQGIRVNLPVVPPSHLIDGNELPKKEQKFKRTLLPLKWNEKRAKEIKLQEENPTYINPELEAFRRQEWTRRLNGYWFYNNGKPTYMTGMHYMYCNWWKCDFGYPDFRIPDLHKFYFDQYCIEDPNCYGSNEICNRRDGKTARLGLFMYEYISRTPNTYGGLQSKTGVDAGKVFDLSVILPWKNLPDFFRPTYDFNNTQRSELRFYKPLKKGKNALQNFSNSNEELQSILNFKTSNIFSYDGYKLHRYGGDEVGKTEEVNVWERHQVVMPCMEQNGEIIGKAYYTTTVEDMKSGGEPFKRLWEASDPKVRSSNGRTKSGLYKYYKPAYQGWKYDAYGFPLEKEAKKYFLAERELRKDDPRALSSYIRKFSFTEEEAFMVDGDNCEFNAMILNERLSYLNLTPNIVSRGDFIWKNGIEPDVEQDGKIIFKHNSRNGKFRISWLPEKDEQTNLIKRLRTIKGVPHFMPINDQKFCIATDPIDHGVTVDGRRSNAATYVFRKFDLLVDDPNKVNEENQYDWQTHNFVVQYIHRPNEPTMYYDDMIKLCVFFGCQILAENQKRGIITHFQNKGYGAFIMNRPKETFTAKNNVQDTPGIPSSKPMIQQYTGKLQTFVEYHGHRIPFKELVTDLLGFDPNKPTKFDATVAAGFTLIAAENVKAKPIETVGGLEYVQFYDNSGNRSKPITN